MQEDDLDRLLAEMAANPAKPSQDLMARVLADALATQPVTSSFPVREHARQRGGFARLSALFGGAPALGAVAAAAVFGLALGYFIPDTMDALANSVIPYGTEDFFPSVDFLSTEG